MRRWGGGFWERRRWWVGGGKCAIRCVKAGYACAILHRGRVQSTLGSLFHAQRFGQLVSDGSIAVLLDRRKLREDTDTGGWKRRWLTLCRWFTRSFKPAVLFDVPIFQHVKKFDYLCWLRTLVLRAEKLVGLHRGYDLSFCCLSHPYDCFYLTRDAADWYRKWSSERRKRINGRELRLLSWRNLEFFALP